MSLAQEQLRLARASSLRFTEDEVQRPDAQITKEILAFFSDFGQFEEWLEGTISRRLGEKAKSATWGIYRTDAHNQAEGIKGDWQRREKQRIDAQIEQERREWPKTSRPPPGRQSS